VYNLALYVWLARTNGLSLEGPASTSGDELISRLYGSAVARLAQYLIDHGYVDPDEVLDFARDLAWEQDENPRERLAQLVLRGQRLLAKKSGLDPAQAHASLAFLADPEKMAESFTDFVKQKPEYDELRRERFAKGQNPPDANDVLGDIIVSDLLHFDLLLGSDKLELSLASGEQPLTTNGEWDEVAKVVRWQRSLTNDDVLPTICFAAWCQPDVDYQEQHFGRVILRGSDLAEYVSSYSMLTVEQQAEVDRFIEGLEADDNLPKKVKEFVAAHRKVARLEEIGKRLIAATKKKWYPRLVAKAAKGDSRLVAMRSMRRGVTFKLQKENGSAARKSGDKSPYSKDAKNS
jgi:hypothetical protein